MRKRWIPGPQQGQPSLFERKYLRSVPPGIFAGFFASLLEFPYFLRAIHQRPSLTIYATFALAVTVLFLCSIGVALGLAFEFSFDVLLGVQPPGPFSDMSEEGRSSRIRVAAHSLAALVSISGLSFTLARYLSGAYGIFANQLASILVLTLLATIPWFILHTCMARLFVWLMRKSRLLRRIGNAVGAMSIASSWVLFHWVYGDAQYKVRAALSFEILIFLFAVFWLNSYRLLRRTAPYLIVAMTLTAGLAAIVGLPQPTRFVLLRSAGKVEGWILQLPSLHNSPAVSRLRNAISSSVASTFRTRVHAESDLGIAHPLPSLQGPQNSPDIVLLSVDSLRPDRLGCYGSHLGLSPNVDIFASSSTVFANAFAVAPLTVSSVTQMMSGRFEHTISHFRLDLSGVVLVHPQIATIASILRDHGYHTHAFVGAMSLGGFPFMARGFHSISDSNSHHVRFSTGEMLREMISIINGGIEGPNFIWSHIMDVHNGVRDTGSALRGTAAYETAVRFVDHEIGEFLHGLSLTARGRAAVVILTADHGESLGESGLYNHGFMAPMTLRIPLIAHFPNRSPRNISVPVSLIDIAPTILALGGLASTSLPGIDLSKLPKDDIVWRTRPVFHESAFVTTRASMLEVGVTALPWELVYDYRYDLLTLVNLDEDPSGSRNLSGSGLSIEAELLQRLTDFYEQGASPSTSPKAQQ